MKEITTCLWFDGDAEEAARFYTSVFPDSRILRTGRFGEAAAHATGNPVGSVMTVDFELMGRRFTALNGGPHFRFNEAISFFVHCEDQAEIDGYWEKLSAGGEESVCGWLKDRFGLSWQIIPADILELLGDDDPARSERVHTALLKMRKLDLAELRRAAGGS